MGIVSPNFSGGFDVSNIVPAEEFFCNRDTSCCFTGHRDRDLPFGGDVHKQGMKNLLSMLVLIAKAAVLLYQVCQKVSTCAVLR
jgi:hypothetical protein